VSALLDFFSARAEARKKRWKAQYEQHQEKIKDDQLPADELIAEMQYLDKTIREEDRLSLLYDLTASLVVFIIFWVVGAAIFSHLEDWSMGSALYFCYVFFL
jgi:potassium channel subfamily K